MNIESVTPVIVLIAACCTIVSLGYQVFSFHWPRGNEVMRPADKARPGKVLGITALLVVLSWMAVGFDYYNRHLRSASDVSTEQARLSSDNARLEVTGWHPIKAINDDPRHVIVNTDIENKGKSAAIGSAHAAFMVVSNGLSETQIDAIFSYLNSEISIFPVGGNEIYPGQKNLWYSITTDIGSLPIDTALLEKAKYLYAFNIIKYKDSSIDMQRAIYSESCVYFEGVVIHV
jgi:hypothetical protein